MAKHTFLEVTPELFSYLLNDNASAFLTYGKPGIKVFKVGTRDAIEAENAMSADDYGNLVGRKRMNAGA